VIPFSILDLSPIPEGSDASQALRNTLELAQHAELLGYQRFWLAEHHNFVGIASAATSVVIGYVAGGTKTIRVGAGGVMLPNHAPLVIAEQFGTLDALYPGRIDLGLGRAPGTDPLTTRALRRYIGGADTFPQDVVELLAYFEPAVPGQAVQAVPGAGARVPVWILGSSLFGAQLAAQLGLPYAFASHFAPDYLQAALEVYRAHFQPSAHLDKPYAMVGFNVIAADTDAEAQWLFTSVQQQFANIRRGLSTKLQPPRELTDLTPADHAGVAHALACSAVGSRETVRASIEAFVERVQPDELVITGQIFDHAARLRSFEIAAEVRNSLA